MNKKLVPALVILAVLAGGYYFLQSRAGSPGLQTESQIIGEAKEFAKAIESGKPARCTLTKGEDYMEYLIKGKKMRANIKTMVEGKSTMSYMINDERYLYIWAEGQAQGSKMAIPTPEEIDEAEDKLEDYRAETGVPTFESESDYQDLQEEGYTINCTSGSVDDSEFAPPADVTFLDPTAILQEATGQDGQIDYQKLQEQYAGMYPSDN